MAIPILNGSSVKLPGPSLEFETPICQTGTGRLSNDEVVKRQLLH